MKTERDLFIQSFMYERHSENTLVNIGEELLNFIPIISIPTNFVEFYDSFSERIEWNKTRDPAKFNDNISGFEMAKQVINMLGLGLLICPIRIVATYIQRQEMHANHKNDLKNYLKNYSGKDFPKPILADKPDLMYVKVPNFNLNPGDKNVYNPVSGTSTATKDSTTNTSSADLANKPSGSLGL